MKLLQRILIHVLLLTIALGMIFPMLWMVLLSLRENPEQYTSLLQTFAGSLSLKNYTDALLSDAFGTYFLNSVFIGTVVTVANILFCFLSGYAFARKNLVGSKFLFITILGVLIIPPQVIMIPLYRMMVELGWMNTYYALIIPWMVTPFGIFLVRQFVQALPPDMEDAARIDGADEWFIVFRIVMPLCKPVLTVLGIYFFLSN